jgi:hypothetical protein
MSAPLFPGRTNACRRPAARSRPREAAAWTGSADLADALEMAVELNRNGASQRGVRLHCYCLGELPVAGSFHALLDELDRMLTSIVARATWGSLVVCEAAPCGRKIELRISFARDASDEAPSPLAITLETHAVTWPRSPRR